MKTTTHTLKNGLSIIFVDTKAFPTLTTLLLVGAGSRYETRENNGIAHFLEHMFYKGSKNYPNPEIISQIIEGMGGSWNAFTSKDYTGYYIKAASSYFSKMVDILSDLLLRSLFDPKEIEKEKGVIVEEINMYEDMPQRRISELFEGMMFAGSPLGFDIAGSRENVVSFDRSTFVNYMQSLYHPNNAVLVVAGGLEDEKKYLSLIEEKFGKWEIATTSEFIPFKDKQDKLRLNIFDKKTEQAHFCLGFPTFPQSDKRRPALRVLATILGGGASSRLFQEVREKHGLCYYIGTDTEQYKDTGVIVTQSGVAKDVNKVKLAVRATYKEHAKMAAGEIREEDFTRSKEMIKGRLLLSLEDSFHVAHFYGIRKLHEKKIETPEETIAKIDKVTKDEVAALAKELFRPERLDFAIIGPFAEKAITKDDILK